MHVVVRDIIKELKRSDDNSEFYLNWKADGVRQ